MERQTSMTIQRARGDLGEEAAASYLLARGYAVLDRQWRCRYGELDLTARAPDGTVCIVEVKLRRQGSMELPREAVGPAKQRRLRLAAESYLIARELAEAPVRFDVAEVYAQGSALRIEYLEDAFQ